METRYTQKTSITIYYKPGIGWAHYDRDNRKVGPWYRTKAEILADHENYLIRAGWMREGGA